MKTLSPDRLEGRGLELWRGDHRLFSNISFALSRGQLLHVRGANGSGKTSLLRLLCGLSNPETGRVMWNEQPIGRAAHAYRSALSYVGHQDGLHDDLSVIENLLWGIGLKREPEQALVREHLDQIGLARVAHVMAFALSAGQRRRLALLRAVLSTSVLWVLDEPLANLDVDARAWCQEQIVRHVDFGGMVVLTSHQDIAVDAAARITLDLDA